MSVTTSRKFLFTSSAISGGHSVDYILGDDIVVHIKPNCEKKVIVVNDFRNGAWGEEILVPFSWEGPSSPIEVEVIYRDKGVEIGLESQKKQKFERCGDLLEKATLRVPNSIQEVGIFQEKSVQVIKPGHLDLHGTLGLQIPRGQSPNILYVNSPGAEAEHSTPLHKMEDSTAQNPGAGFDPSDAVALIEGEFKKKNWEKVVVTAQAHRASIKNTHDIILYIGRAYIYLGRMQEAERELRWIESHAPEHHGALFYLGVALANLQRYDEARRVLEKCVSLQGSEAKYVFELARVTTRLVNGGFGVLAPHPELIEDAIDLLKRAAELMPRDGRPHRDLSGLLQQKGMLVEALEALDEARRRSPHLNALSIERARVLVRLDRIEEALQAAQEAAESDPANDTAASTVRILERWLEARRGSAFKVGLLPSVNIDATSA
ncbi:tetratricopeptide repeat protein [Roseomonas xinghualingensis]|uniref:tetratricopeptide repeat protein n=1 Tax=Roseomonas xinghualingensis TaxID=2986475 RepID=UPI0021F0F9AD|nr:tetratricopeptide repeat protein [Roseomonas sp. SXEYE001]MCV4208676.1 tetratricopeptide repeat protein [Roseomonas sp. SXEYE001]